MKTLLLAATAVVLASAAHATPSNSNNSDTIATATANPKADATSISGAQAGAQAGATALSGSVSGAVAQGGHGGDANAVALGGQGGDAKASNTGVFGQGQGQIGINGQSQSTSSGASSDQSQGQSLTDNSSHLLAATTGDSTASASGNGAGQSTTFTQVYEATKRSAASAYAAPLQIGSMVCGISKASLALQLPGAGASGQVGQIDQGCERRSTADVFARLGLTYEACVIMMMDPVAKAAGLTVERNCVVAQFVPVQVAPETPAKPVEPRQMAPIPNPVPVYDGERG